MWIAHVMVKGHLVADGPASLIDEINRSGFEQFEKNVAAKVAAKEENGEVSKGGVSE